MNRLTEKDNQGNWCLKGMPWKCLRLGEVITTRVYDRLYGALYKLMKYEDTGLSPEQIEEMDGLYHEKCKEVAELQRSRRWIPVEERLPKIGLKVLITNGEFVKERYLRPDGVWKYGVDTKEVFSRLSSIGVLAWMPLPELDQRTHGKEHS